MPDSSAQRFVIWVSGIVIGLIGLAIAGAGVWLASLGGSWYYAVAGLGILITAGLLIARRPSALLVYALVVLGTVSWAVAEIRFDWWQLAPRGDIIFLIGLYLLMPWIGRALVGHPGERGVSAWRGSGLALTGSLVIAAIVGGIALFSKII